MTTPTWPVAIVGSGDLATDLLTKIAWGGGTLQLVAMAGIDPADRALAAASRLGVPTTADGIAGLLAMPQCDNIKLVFDATSATDGHQSWKILQENGIRVIHLADAGDGPYCIPAVNLDDHLDSMDLTMATHGAQATVPIVAAVAQSGTVCYAEVVSSVCALAVGADARADVDQFLETTSAALCATGGARRGKVVMVLNPADPPMLMRNTVYCLLDTDPDPQIVQNDIEAMVNRVNQYAPGYRLKQRVQFEKFGTANALNIPQIGAFTGTRVTVLLEVSGARDHLPPYAGNLDIMTAAAKATAERMAEHARAAA